jgi:hypothetical protein
LVEARATVLHDLPQQGSIRHQSESIPTIAVVNLFWLTFRWASASFRIRPADNLSNASSIKTPGRPADTALGVPLSLIAPLLGLIGIRPGSCRNQLVGSVIYSAALIVVTTLFVHAGGSRQSPVQEKRDPQLGGAHPER